MNDAPAAPAAAGPIEGFIDVDGVPLWYEVTGQGHPLVLVHAGIADARMWAPQVAAFAASFRVIHFDQRGYGRSGAAPGDFAPHEDLGALLAALGVRRAHLVGASMGGGVALDLALADPALVSALVLVGSGPNGLPASAGLRAQWAAVDAAYEAAGLDAAVELELRMWVDGPGRGPDAVDPAVRERVREMNAAIFAREAAQDAEAQPQPLRPPAADRLAEVRAPTLVVVGAADQPDKLAAAALMAARIPNARKVVVPDTAHLPSLERPEAFNRLLHAFLAEIKPGAGETG